MIEFTNKELKFLLECVQVASEYIEGTETIENKIKKYLKNGNIKTEDKGNNANNVLNEFQAEIVAGVVPARKIFDINGNIIPLDKLEKSASLILLKEIKAALDKAGILKQFAPDSMQDIDIKPYRKNEYILTPEQGPKYTYNVSSKRLKKVE